MRIDRLTIKGLLRFTDAVTLDFRGVPAGLIAIVGENGAGKSTILDAMFAAWYGVLPSRIGRPLADFVGGARDAYLEVEATFDTGAFRARQNIDGQARRRDAVLVPIVDGRPGAPLTDGKASTFDRYIADTFPAREVVLASAFAAQNRQGSFTALEPKDQRDLFSTLLGLDRYEGYATTARAAALTLGRRVAALGGELAILQQLTPDSEADALGATGNQLMIAQIEADARTATLAADAARLDALLTTQQGGARAYLEARGLVDALRAERQGLLREDAALVAQRPTVEADWTRDRAAVGRGADLERRAVAEARAVLTAPADLDRRRDVDLEAIRVACEVDVKDKQTRIANNAALVDVGDVVRAAVARLDALDAAQRDVGDQLVTARDLERHATRAAAQAAAAVSNLGDVEGRLVRARADAGLLEAVPFGDRCAEAGCRFVLGAVIARDQIVTLEADVVRLAAARTAAATAQADADARRAAVAALNDRALAIQADMAALGDARANLARLNAAETRIGELHAEINRRCTDAAAAALAVHATHRQALADWAVRDAALTRRLAGLDASTVEDLAVVDARRATRLDAITAALADVGTRIGAVDARLADAEAVVASTWAAFDALGATQAAAEACAADRRTAAATSARLEADIAAFEARRALFVARVADRDALQARWGALAEDVDDWDLLARVFGREGLPVIEIDAAGPTVSALANDLLEACFGGRFRVDLVTQEAKAGGKGVKEAFKLKVYDGARGGDDRDLADLSGGEQVIVDEALKSAIALFVNQRNVVPIRTCWRDETTGALDPENALRYVAMLRRLRERAGVHHLFFISHNAEAAALADAQIVVADGGAVLRFPPFAHGGTV